MCKQKHCAVGNIMCIAALLIIIVPVGIACIVLGYGMGDNPCILCWEERIAMILAALTMIFITRYGLQLRYIGTLVLICVYGLWAGFRHSSGHMLKDIGQGFGPAILGVHTYVWVMAIFMCILFSGAIVLLFIKNSEPGFLSPFTWTWFNRFTVLVFLFIVVMNIIQAFTQVGPPPFIGQGDPYRMTFDSSRTKWSMAHWASLSSFSFDAGYHIPRPDFSEAGVRHKIFSPPLTLIRKIPLPDTIKGGATGLSYNPQKNIFAVVTSDNHIYILNGDLSKILSFVKIDRTFSVELSNMAGVTFDSDNTLLLVTDHKSYVRLRLDENARFKDNYWLFTDGTDGISELARDRFSTVRSKYNYIGDIAWDAENHEYMAITLPSKQHPNLIAMRFDGQDYQLNSETRIKITDSDDGNIPFITGIFVKNGAVYLLDHNTRQIIVMDPKCNSVIDTKSVPAVPNPQGVTIEGNRLLVLNTDKTGNRVYEYSMNVVPYH
ncbi:disulfide bond formation protein B [Salmonella enterica subsp. enterica serovar Bredeney]|nr:disulfide bond formation protein B [Salmonella enterica subsp. enterica serovar Bredeney]